MIGIWCLTMCMWTKLLRFKLLQTPDVCFFFFFVWGRVKKCDSCVVDDRVGKQMVSFSLILTCVNRVCTDLSFKGLSLWSVNRRINSELTFTAFNGCLFFFFFFALSDNFWSFPVLLFRTAYLSVYFFWHLIGESF